MSNRSETVFLVLSPRKMHGLSVRVALRAPRLAADEVAMELDIRVPAAMFQRPALRGQIEVPADQVNRPVITAAVLDNIRSELNRQLGVDLQIHVIEPEAQQ